MKSIFIGQSYRTVLYLTGGLEPRHEFEHGRGAALHRFVRLQQTLPDVARETDRHVRERFGAIYMNGGVCDGVWGGMGGYVGVWGGMGLYYAFWLA